eukprot:TRINITY_DN3691_c0_g1_i1.p1 TRINITY_DN3691_c0_g1~~TRINITY_DN3691_c0_g1_i1.p1  ORF type:complete len:800 (+),score=253.25 TRINITY_DN3691_c0_g1_i1:50-2401(+)
MAERGDEMARRLVDAFQEIAANSTADREQHVSEVRSILDAHARRLHAEGTPSLSPRSNPAETAADHPAPTLPIGVRLGSEETVASRGQLLSAWEVEPTSQQPQLSEPPSFYERSIQWRQRQSKAIERMREHARDKETEACTWRPSIRPPPQELRRGGGSALELSVEERLWLRGEQTRTKLQNRRAQRLSDERASCTFRPTVNRQDAGTSGDDGVFDRLYRQGMQRKAGSPGPRHEVLYTTFPPGTTRKERMSEEEVRKVETELRDIEALFANSRVRQHLKHCDPGGLLPSREVEMTLQGVLEGRQVQSNYRETDDESESMSSGAASPAEDDFLVRQSQHEADRQKKLARIAAENAPRHRPMIERRSRMMCDRARKKRQQLAPAAGATEQQEERLRRLCCEVAESRCKLRKIQHECQVLLRQLREIEKQPRADGTPVPEGCSGRLRAELTPLLKWKHEGVVTVGGATMDTQTPEELRDATEPSCARQSVLFGRNAERESVAAAERLLRERRKMAQGEHDAGWVGPYGRVLSGWLRELLRSRDALFDVRVMSERLRDTLEVEKGKALAATGGALPWEAVMKLELQRDPCKPTDIVQRMKEHSGRPDSPQELEPGQFQRGDEVLVRRGQGGKWVQATFLEIRDKDMYVVEQWSDKPCKVPYRALTANVRPNQARIRQRQAEEQRRAAAEKSRVTELPPGIQAPTSDYGRDALGDYVRKLDEQQRTREDDRRQKRLCAAQVEDEQCTHVPRVHPAPAYITRIAHSMALLRGEKDESDHRYTQMHAQS